MVKKYDKWFYYRLISTIVIIGGLITIYINYIVNGDWVRRVDYPFSIVLFNDQFFSYFTFQSNILIAIWFLIATIFYFRKFYFIDNIFIKIAVTSYICLTGAIYITTILPALFLQSSKAPVREIISGLFLHLVVPILMLIEMIFNRTSLNMTWKKYFKRNFWLYLIYPITYTLMVVARIFLYLNDPNLKNLPFMIIFPYLPLFDTTKNFVELAPEYGKIFGLTAAFVFYIYALFIMINLALIAFCKRKPHKKKSKEN